jgi:hypothetical protein
MPASTIGNPVMPSHHILKAVLLSSYFIFWAC